MQGRGTKAGSLVRRKRAGRVQEVDSQAPEMCASERDDGETKGCGGYH